MRDDLKKLCLSSEWSGNQAILNCMFSTTVKLIPRCYNVTTDQINDITFKTGKVFHFVGNKKVWDGAVLFDRFDKDILYTVGYPILYKLSRLYDKQCKIIF